MIDLQTLPADEAERLAYAEGYPGTAALFARIADLEAQVALFGPVVAALDNLIWACSGVDYMEDEYEDEMQAARDARDAWDAIQ